MADQRQSPINLDAIKVLVSVLAAIGGLTTFFFWIGNAVVMARLRSYNLFGVVPYTEEYAREVSYQFFQDILTIEPYFRQPILSLWFVVGLLLYFFTIPVRRRKEAGDGRDNTGWLEYWSRWLKSCEGSGEGGDKKTGRLRKCLKIIPGTHRLLYDNSVNYILFLFLPVVPFIALYTNLPLTNIAKDIGRNDIALQKVNDYIHKDDKKGGVIVFNRSGSPVDGGVARDRFYADIDESLYIETSLTKEWAESILAGWEEKQPDSDKVKEKELKGDESKKIECEKKGRLFSMIERFQAKHNIVEKCAYEFNGDFKKTRTYELLLDMQLNTELKKRLFDSVTSLSRVLRTEINYNLSGLSSFVLIPSSYRTVNRSLDDLHTLSKNIERHFAPANEETRDVMRLISGIRPLDFGSVILSLTFLAILGIFFYLLLDVWNLKGLKSLQRCYYSLMVLFLLLLSVALPRAYGMYRYELNINKLRAIEFAADDQLGGMKDKINALLEESGNSLYTLGPIDGEDLVISAVDFTKEVDGRIVPEIFNLRIGKERHRLIEVEPVSSKELTRVITVLKHGRLFAER